MVIETPPGEETQVDYLRRQPFCGPPTCLHPDSIDIRELAESERGGSGGRGLTSGWAKLLILNGGQGRNRTADASLFRAAYRVG